MGSLLLTRAAFQETTGSGGTARVPPANDSLTHKQDFCHRRTVLTLPRQTSRDFTSKEPNLKAVRGDRSQKTRVGRSSTSLRSLEESSQALLELSWSPELSCRPAVWSQLASWLPSD